MFKCVHGFALKVLCDIIVMASDVNERNIRNIDLLTLYVSKSNIESTKNLLNMQVVYQNVFKYTGGKIWNSVPDNIQNAP